MKKIILLFFVLSFTINAQENKPLNSIYTVISRDYGNYLSGGDLGVNFVYEESIALGVGWMGNLYLNENYPKDNSSAIGEISRSSHFHATLGKIIKIKKSSLIRFNLSGGLAMSFYNVVENFVRESEYNDGNYFYEYDSNIYTNVSLVLAPKVEITIFSWGGFQISPKVVLNQRKSFYGIGLGLMLGK